MSTSSGEIRQDTRFGLFVRKYGVALLARRLEVDSSSIYHWLRGSTSPDPVNALKLQRLAKRRRIVLSLDEIYQHSSEVRGAGRATSSLKPKPARV